MKFGFQSSALKIAKRYARAVFETAGEQKRLDKTHRDLALVQELIEKSRDLENFLHNPEIPATKRTAILKSLFQKRLDPLVYRFLLFLQQKDRLPLLHQIILLFNEFYLAHKNILQVNITSASGLTKEQQALLNKRLKSRFQKEIHSHWQTNDQLRGGFKIQIDDLIYDCSIQSHLDEFKQKIINA